MDITVKFLDGLVFVFEDDLVLKKINYGVTYSQTSGLSFSESSISRYSLKSEAQLKDFKDTYGDELWLKCFNVWIKNYTVIGKELL